MALFRVDLPRPGQRCTLTPPGLSALAFIYTVPCPMPTGGPQQAQGGEWEHLSVTFKIGKTP